MVDKGVLYREWLERMSGLSFTLEQAIQEMIVEIDKGNGAEVDRRIEDIVYVKSLNGKRSLEFLDELERVLER